MTLALQEVPAPETIESPLPGGLASIVRFFLDFPQPLQIAGLVVAAIVAVALLGLLWVRRVAVLGWLKTRPRAFYVGVAGAAVVLTFAGAIVGLMGWNYVQHDNGFCTGCHVMGPAFVKFAESEHAQLECHDCHQQPITASMRQLYLWVLERPEDIGPHAPVANEVCARCHIQEDPNETWEAIAATQGHQVHLTSSAPALADVQCVTCHGQEVHRFTPAQETCAMSGCHLPAHTDIVLGRMAGAETSFHCLVCHQFTAPGNGLPADGTLAAERLMPGIAACGTCHAMAPVIDDIVASGDPHRGVCGACHNPHTQTTPAAAFETCTSAGCHANPASLTPFHRGLHAGVVDQCATCHTAHGWTVDAADCRGCHTDLSE